MQAINNSPPPSDAWVQIWTNGDLKTVEQARHFIEQERRLMEKEEEVNANN